MISKNMLNLPPPRKTKATIMTFPILKTFKHLGVTIEWIMLLFSYNYVELFYNSIHFVCSLPL